MKNTTLVFGVFLLLLFNGCSKKNDEVIDEENILDGGKIYTSQIIEISHNNILQVEYNATLGNNSVKVIKISDEKLNFLVPSDITIGENILHIPGLNNFKIKYEIEKTILLKTPQEIITPVIDEFTTFTNNLPSTDTESEYLTHFFSQYKKYFESLPVDEKIKLAEYYQNNKSLFDKIINGTYNQKSNGEIITYIKHKSAILALSGGVAVAILAPDPVTKLIAIGVVMVAWKKAKDYGLHLANSKLKKINFIINSITSQLQKSNSTHIEFQTSTSKEIDFELLQRDLISSDNNGITEGITTFFTSSDLLNEVIDKINTLITEINKVTFFSNINLIEKDVLPNDSQEEKAIISEELFNKITFSVESDNIEIEEISFANNKLKATFKIIDESIVNEFVETKLNYTFKDDFNDVSGSFPLKIHVKNIFGTWKIDASDTCTNSDNSTFSDSYSGEIILNEDNTVTYVGVDNSNTVSNSFTFSNNTLTITTTYNDYTTTPCGQGAQLVTDIQVLQYDTVNDSFSGTTQSSADDVEITNQAGTCTILGRTCSGTITLKR